MALNNQKKSVKPQEQKEAKNNKKNNTKKNTNTASKNKPQNRKNGAKNRRRKPKEVAKQPLKIISLGGLNEIGKNITAYECGEDIILIDCGMAFPDDDMLGIDIVIPDFSYIETNISKVKAIFITHGHEDHIGALPYLLKKFDIPVYATKLSIALIDCKLKEFGMQGKVKLNPISPKDVVKVGCMQVEAIRVNHSIPDAVAFAIHTPTGVVIQTGDFKIDYTPIEGSPADLARFGELGNKGVLALLSDSTNAERPGSTMSERKVGETFDALFKRAVNKRIIIATFSSNIHRIQQIVDCAARYDRKVAVSGRSMINVVGIAVELGYLRVPSGVLVDIDHISRYPEDKLVIITTGSQGEPMSALSRMAMGDHRKVEVSNRDFIIISATPIPGNERLVSRVVNELLKLGAEVVYEKEKMYEVHVSGHACQDELRLMLNLVRPKFFIPVHGEYKHLKKHADLAVSMGVKSENVIISDIGKVIETDSVTMKISGSVPAGRVLVDGLGVGDVGNIVLRDRKHLAQDGLIVLVVTIDSQTGDVLAGPDIVSRGFVYVRESEQLMENAKNVANLALKECLDKNMHDWNNIKSVVRDALSNFVFQQTKRNPMILPIIMEV